MTNHPNRSRFTDEQPARAWTNPYMWRRLRDDSREVWVLINPFGVVVAGVDDEDGHWSYRHNGKAVPADDKGRAMQMAESAVEQRRALVPISNQY